MNLTSAMGGSQSDIANMSWEGGLYAKLLSNYQFIDFNCGASSNNAIYSQMSECITSASFSTSGNPSYFG